MLRGLLLRSPRGRFCMSCEFVVDAENGSRERQELRHDEEHVSGDIMVFTY